MDKMRLRLAKTARDQRPVLTTAPRIKLFGLFVTSMVGAHSQSKMTDSVSQMFNILYEDADHVFTTVSLLPLTNTPTQILRDSLRVCVFPVCVQHEGVHNLSFHFATLCCITTNK